MKRSEVVELHYIAAVRNLPSIFEHGILSHHRAERLEHVSVANPGVQERRAVIRLPNRRTLHDCVNLYLNARNPMMYTLRERHSELCVLRVDPCLLDLHGSIISDGNAADSFTRFDPPDVGLIQINAGELFAQYWNDAPDSYALEEKKRRRCAEVLVPDLVSSQHIRGVYVSCDSVRTLPELTRLGCPVRVSAQMFFQAPGVVSRDDLWT